MSPATSRCSTIARTFGAEGHHYALVCVDGLEPGRSYVGLARRGDPVAPPGPRVPPSIIRTVDPEGRVD